MREDIHELTRGQWRGILAHYGLTQAELSGKHGPCPMCGGKDRFRFAGTGGSGRWFCNQCTGDEGGSGVDLVMALRGVDFAEAARDIKSLIGREDVPHEPPPPPADPDAERERRVRLWKSGRQMTPDDLAGQYLEARGVGQPSFPPSLRFCRSAFYAPGVFYPAMLAAVQAPDGRCVSVHQTFLSGPRKAPVDKPRMLTKGELPAGSAVRLTPPDEVLGIAEGIETALAAGGRFDVPTWAALTAGGMQRWLAPAGTAEVVIFPDNDANGTGTRAAAALAERLTGEGIKVSIHLPPQVGTDWADHIGETAA